MCETFINETPSKREAETYDGKKELFMPVSQQVHIKRQIRCVLSIMMISWDDFMDRCDYSYTVPALRVRNSLMI